MPKTEDDTFNALSRIKFSDAVKVMLGAIDNNISKISLIEYFAQDDYTEWADGWAKSLKDGNTGWTLEQFVAECKRWNDEFGR